MENLGIDAVSGPYRFAQELAAHPRPKTVYLCSAILDGGLGTQKTVMLQSLLTELGIDVPISTPTRISNNNRYSVQSQIEMFRNLRRLAPQAIVCSVHMFHEDALAELENYQKEGGIVVTYDLPNALACDKVVFDREDNAYHAARYLLEKRHRRLGLAVSRRANVGEANLNVTQDARTSGFMRALQERGNTEPVWFPEISGPSQGGEEMARQFLALKERPSALCITNDYVALAFMVEIMQAGLTIPDDVSIIGCENQNIATYCPVKLTSVTQPLDEIAKAVVSLLTARLEGDKWPPRTITIRGKIIERKTVALCCS